MYHEGEIGKDTSVQRITGGYHKACRVMANCDPEGPIMYLMSHK